MGPLLRMIAHNKTKQTFAQIIEDAALECSQAKPLCQYSMKIYVIKFE